MKFMNKQKRQLKIGYYQMKELLYTRKMNRAKTFEEESYYCKLIDVCSAMVLSLIDEQKGKRA